MSDSFVSYYAVFFLFLAAGEAYQRSIAQRVSCTLDEVKEVLLLLGKLEGMDSSQEGSSGLYSSGSSNGCSSVLEDKEKSPVSNEDLSGLRSSSTESVSVVAKSHTRSTHEGEAVLEHSVQVTSSQDSKARDLSVESDKADSRITVTLTSPNVSPPPEACSSSPESVVSPVSQKGEGSGPSSVPQSSVSSRTRRRGRRRRKSKKRGRKTATECNSSGGVSGSESGSDKLQGSGPSAVSGSGSDMGSVPGSGSVSEGSVSDSRLNPLLQIPSPSPSRSEPRSEKEAASSAGSGSGSGSDLLSEKEARSGSWSGSGSGIEIPPVRVPPESTLFEAGLGFPCSNNATHGLLTERGRSRHYFESR